MGKGAGGFLGGSGQNSGNTSETKNETTNTTITQDQRVVAGDRSIIAAGGSTLNVETLDAQVAQAALDNMYKVAGAGFDFAGNTVNKALNSSVSLAQSGLDYAAISNRETLAASNKAISLSADAFKAAAAGDTSQLQDTLKQIALGVLITGGALGAVYLYKRK